MINWVMSLVFLMVVISIYYFIGFIIEKIFLNELNKTTYVYKIMIGFIITSFIQWCVGFPAQAFHVNWKVYSTILFVIYIIVIAVIVYYCRVNKTFLNLMDKKNVLNHLKKYWFVYLLVCLFSFFSMTSQLPYFEMNYDDHYYIGRIVQEIGASKLAIENYFTGTVQPVSFDRIITTYEISYGFWAQLFYIDPSFFARGTMVVLNYYLIFMSFQAVSEMFIKNKYLAQYGLIGIALLIIPAGYLWINKQTMMYDGWQMNTAIWYGSSIVRLMFIPVILVLFQSFRYKKFKGVCLLLTTVIAFLSYSAITLPIFILFTMSTIIYSLLHLIFTKNSKKKILAFLLLLGFLIIIYVIYQLNFQHPILVKIEQAAMQFSVDNKFRLEGSNLFLPSFILSMIAMFVVKKKYQVQHMIFLIASIIIFLPMFIYILSISSLGYFFVIARTFTAMQVMWLVISGAILIRGIERIKYITPIITITLLIGLLIFHINHLQIYKTINFSGSGTSQAGYSLNRLIRNPYMIPEIYIEIGNFFEEKEGDERFQIISPQFTKYENGNLHLNAGLIMVANNIEICNSQYGMCNGMTDTNKKILNDFFEGNVSNIETLHNIIQKSSIDYIIADEESVQTIIYYLQGNVILEMNSLNQDTLYLIEI